MRPALLLAALLLPLASWAGEQPDVPQRPHAARFIALGEDRPDQVHEVHLEAGVPTIIWTPCRTNARGTGVVRRRGGPIFPGEVVITGRKLFITPSRALAPGERYPLAIRLADGADLALLLTRPPAGARADGEVFLTYDADGLRVQLASMTERARGFEQRLHQVLIEQESEDFALAGLLAGGHAELTAFEKIGERRLVADERGWVALQTWSTRHGPRKVAVMLIVLNTSSAPMELQARAPYSRNTLVSVPVSVRSSGQIAPGARGRLALVLDGAALPAEDEALTLDLQVRRGAAQTELSADLVAGDFGSDWWPF